MNNEIDISNPNFQKNTPVDDRILVTLSFYQRFLLSRFHPTKELVLTTSGDGEDFLIFMYHFKDSYVKSQN